MKIDLFDTTLRDGAQNPGISFSVEDKLRIIKALDEFGMDYIEGGNPGSNPKDFELFEKAAALSLKHAKIAAFGPTCRAGAQAADDENLRKILRSGADIAVIFGKSWLLHVERIIKTTAAENLRIIFDSIKFLRDNGRRVFFDAEHFFDGYTGDKVYALEVLETAGSAGAEVMVLCDTNGGMTPAQIGGIVREVKKKSDVKLGIHCHNDTGLAAASTIEAVSGGAAHIQGTVNGIGERCGNADLCVLIPNLQLKLNYDCVPAENLKTLTELARFTAEISNISFNESAPFVGSHAFTHKAGMHIDAVNKLPASCEHINPEAVGNSRGTLISEMAGRAALLGRMKTFAGGRINKNSAELGQVLELVKSRENEGYQFENAEGSLDLIILESLKKRGDFFTVKSFKIVPAEPFKTDTTGAMIKIKVGDSEEITAAEGDGPVNALDKALRGALVRFYSNLKNMKLTDYKVRVLNSNEGTAAKVRVVIESSDNAHIWRTIGVSTDIIEASWKALIDSVEYKLSLDAGLF